MKFVKPPSDSETNWGVITCLECTKKIMERTHDLCTCDCHKGKW